MIDIGNLELGAIGGALGTAIIALFAKVERSDRERHASELKCREDLQATNNKIVEIQSAQIEAQRELLGILGSRYSDHVGRTPRPPGAPPLD